MITAIIIDDEFACRNYLKNMIGKYFDKQMHVFGVAQDVAEGVELIKQYRPDLVFVDVVTPGENGLKLFDCFPEGPPFEVVFTTVYKDYAISAIKKGVFDYLLKPVDKIDILSLINRYEKRARQKRIGNTMLYVNSNNCNAPKIPIATNGGITYLEDYLFLYAKADGAYTEIHTADGRMLLLSKSLKEFEQMTANCNFLRTHKSYIINLAYVSEFVKKDELFVVLKNNLRIPLSTRRKDEFLERISVNEHGGDR